MRFLTALLALLGSFSAHLTAPNAVGAQACNADSSGGFDEGSGRSVSIETSCPGAGDSELGSELYDYERIVRAEPMLCAGTPDALQETITWYYAGTNDVAGRIVRCVGADVPDPALPPAPPSALEVFRSAPLPLPEVHVNPRVRGLVGLQTWLWWGADTAVPPLSVTAGEWSASIEVQASTITWDLGNGDVLSGDGAGTGEADPSLTYVYERQCDCTVTLTVGWSGVVTLTHPLLAAPLVEAVGPVAFSDTFTYVVEEREAVIIG